MSSNNVVWVMPYERWYHVFYSGCVDNTPIEPDYEDFYYKKFDCRKDALEYGHNVVNKIDAESWEEGMTGVEYGVCELPFNVKGKNLQPLLKRVEDLEAFKDKFIMSRDRYNIDSIVDDVVKHNKQLMDLKYKIGGVKIRQEHPNRLNYKLDMIDDIIDTWKQEIRDLQFSIEQFEAWKKELLK